MLIKEERLEEKGNKVVKKYFGTDKEHITAVVTEAVSDDIPDGTMQELPEPDEQDVVQAQILLNQADIIAKQQEQDEVLAEMLLQQSVKQQEHDEVLAAILLNQMGGGEADV